MGVLTSDNWSDAWQARGIISYGHKPINFKSVNKLSGQPRSIGITLKTPGLNFYKDTQPLQMVAGDQIEEQPMNKKILWRGLGIAGIVFLAAGMFSYHIWQQADQNLRSGILRQAYRVVETIDLDYLQTLSGTRTDQQLPEYEYLKRQLIRTRQVFPESRFLYLMGQKADGDVFFYIDSEPPGSAEESFPGDIYTDVTGPLLKAFSESQAGIDGPMSDQWGTWISALVPISDPYSGAVLAVFGMDVDAGEWRQMVARQCTVPFILTGLLALLIPASYILLAWRATLPPLHLAKWRLSNAEAAITLVLGLLLTSLIAWEAHTNEQRSRQGAFERIAAARSSYVLTHLNNLEKYQLEGLGRFFEASTFVNRQEFSIYTSGLGSDPAMQAWGWIPVVDRRDLPQFVETARQDGMPNFKVWELDKNGQPIPARERDRYYPVLYVAPPAGNEVVMGYDQGSEQMRRKAIEEAASSRRITATGPITLVQEIEDQIGILVFRPVFANSAQNTPTGFVAAALRMGNLLQVALGPRYGLEISVFLELYYVESGGEPILLAGNTPQEMTAAHFEGQLHSRPYADFQFVQPVHAFGNVFTLVAHPGPLFNQIYPQRAGWSTTLFGIITTGLLTLLTNVLVSRREKLTQLVAERTAELAQSEADYRELFEAESDAIFLIDKQSGKVLQANRAASFLYGYSHAELVTLKVTDFQEKSKKTPKAAQEDPSDQEKTITIRLDWHKRKNGTIFPVEITISFFERKGMPVYIAAIRDITKRKMAEKTMLLQSTALQSTANAIVITDRRGRIEWANLSFSILTGYSLAEAMGENPGDLVKSGAHDLRFYQHLWDTILSGKTWSGELLNRKKDGSIYNEQMTVTPVKANGAEITHFIAIKQDITEQKKREHELESLAAVSEALRSASTRTDLLTMVVDQLVVLLNTDGAALVLRDTHTGESGVEAIRGEFMKELREHLLSGTGNFGQIYETGTPFVTQELTNEEGVAWSGELEGMHAVAGVPLIVRTQVIGALWIERQGAFDPAEIRLLTSIADMAANAIHRETSREETIQQLERLATLHSMDQMVIGGLDLKVILKFIIDKVATHLNVEAVAVLLFNPHTQQLEFADGRGFWTNAIETTHLGIGEGMAGAVAGEQKTLYLPDLASSTLSLPPIILNEGFVSYFATPLVVKGQVKGVLEVFQRNRIDPGSGWVNFFELLAGQTAIAIDNAQLFEGLQRSNQELSLAYDATIEGWSRAMDLRDNDTEGHTQRVTELTIRLARAAGVSEKEIVHMRRGALLHDMGKLGVPDSILLKPGPLTESEWEIMHTHPLLVYEMLAPIAYLRPALDIPTYHHEKWDGSGYPRGIRGEQIPLAARIFAVVDVFDALISERPYRPAWSKEAAIAYICTSSGTHFDPQSVDLFLKLIEEDQVRSEEQLPGS